MGKGKLRRFPRKSKVIEKLLKRYNLKMVNVPLSKYDPKDLRGLPTFDEQVEPEVRHGQREEG